MKTIEEKAKAYDEALKAAIAAHKDEDRHLKATLERIFPELQESEDERIRKGLIKALSSIGKRNWGGIDVFESISWLEKQGEQKETLCDKCRKEQPSHSCQDITELGRCALEKQGEQKHDDKVESFDYEGLTDFERTLADICIGWIGEELGWKQYIKDNADVLFKIAIEKFSSVQDAPFEQKPADWSEEDDIMVRDILGWLPAKSRPEYNQRCVDWLKSLKPRNRWKPSEEQMKQLGWIAEQNKDNMIGKELISLYQDLKKLREE